MKMKKNYSIGGMIIPGLVILSGCGNSRDGKVTEDTTAMTEEVREDTVALPKRYVLSATGIGPLTVGMPIKEWPEETEGLYEYVEASEGGDANQYNFIGENDPAITVLDFGGGKADLLIVDDPRIEAQVGDTVVNMTTSFSRLLTLPGVKASWEQLDDEGMWYWKCSGLWFAPSLEHLPPKLADKLYNSERAPTAEDFPEDITIGYIATGLPF